MFFIFVSGIFLWTLTLYIYFFVDTGDYLTYWGRLNYATAYPMCFGLAWFFYFFPRKSIAFSKKIEQTALIVTIILTIITFFTPLIDKKEIMTSMGPKVEFGLFYPLYPLYLIIHLIVVVFLGVKKINNSKGVEKSKIKYVFWGFLPASAFLVLTNTILPIYNIYIIWEYSSVIMAPVALVSFYSMQKHRFLNFSAVTLNLIRKVIFFSAVILLGLLLNFILQNIGYKLNLFTNILILIIEVFIYIKFEEFFPKFVPYNLKRFQISMTELRAELWFCDSYKKLIYYLEKYFIIDLNISKAKVFLIRKKLSKINLPLYVADHFTNYLEENKIDLFVKDEVPFLDMSPKDKKIIFETMHKLNASVCLSLFAEEKLIGFFVLGSKENNKPYIKEEIEMIQGLKKNLEICFMNILLKRNLKEENNLMKATIEKKTKQIKKQYQKIKDLLEQQSSFIAVTAHEFRTPLSIAIFQLQDMLEDESEVLQMEDLRIVEKYLNNLHKLTQNLFDVQQYDLNKIELKQEKVDLLEFVQLVIRDCKKLVQKKNLKCTFSNNLKKRVFCNFDKQKMLQVFHNILTNGIKFTPENGRLELELVNEGNRAVLIKIIDTGKGISEKNKKRIFEKFQTETLNSSTGIGLGLYICKKIVDLHKGYIWVKDTPGGGATFVIKFKTL